MTYLDKIKRRYQQLLNIPDGVKTLEQTRLINEYYEYIKLLEFKNEN
jgi:hypothetical protein